MVSNKGVAVGPCDVPGVNYTNKTVMYLESNAPLLAGCLGLSDSSEVHHLVYKDEHTAPVFKSWVTYKKAQFGTKLSSNKLAIKSTIVDLPQELEYQAVIFGDTKPRLGQPKLVTETSIAPLVCLWYVVRLMRLRPALFPHTDLRANPKQLSRYDWLHGWKLLIWASRMLTTGKYSDRKNPAIQPDVWDAKAGAVAGSAPPTAASTAAEDDDDEDANIKPSHLTFGLDLDDFIAVWEQIDKAATAQPMDIQAQIARKNAMHHTVMGDVHKALDSRRDDIVRPAMSAADRAHLLSFAMRLDDFLGECLCYEPSTMEPPAESATRMSLKKLGSAGKAVQNRISTKIDQDPAMDNDAAQTQYDETENATAVEKTAQMSLAELDRLRQVSAVPRSYAVACESLGFDPAEPTTRPHGSKRKTRWKPHQISGADWMLRQETTPVGGGIVGDGCGTGKTATMLLLIDRAADLPPQSVGDLPTRYLPTLIVCPLGMISTWRAEATERFGTKLTLKTFWGQSAHTRGIADKNRKISQEEELLEFMDQLDPQDPATARTIILSTYQTFALRSTKPIKSTEQVDAAAARSADRSAIDELGVYQDTHREDDDDDDHAQPRLKTAARKMPTRFTSSMTGRFARVVCDEGHCVKSINTRFHQCIALLNAPHKWIVSATPLHNRAVDLAGYLALLYTPALAGSAGAGAAGEIDDQDPVGDYRRYSEMADLPEKPPYHLLAPKKFLRLATHGHLSAREGFFAIPIILRLICLRRAMGDAVDLQDPSKGTIGDDIPDMVVATVELRHPPPVQKVHDQRFVEIATAMRNGGGRQREDGERSGYVDWGAIRLLGHSSFTPVLDRFLLRTCISDTLASSVEKYIGRNDLGFGYLWAAVNEDKKHLVPPTKLAQAVWLMAECVKLRYVFRVFMQEGLWDVTGEKKQARFVLFCHWPLVLWYVQLFLEALNVDYEVVRASMTESQRADATGRFTDPNSSCRILLTTFACGAHGLNLHHTCNHVIILEPALNFNTLLQALNRVHRMGQKLIQKIWILYQRQSVSVWLEANSTRKAIPQIAAELYNVLRHRVEQLTNEMEATQGSSATTDLDEHERKARAMQAEADFIALAAQEHLQAVLGQSYSRLDFDSSEITNALAEPGQGGAAQPQQPKTPKKKRRAGPTEEDTNGKRKRKRAKRTKSAKTVSAEDDVGENDTDVDDARDGSGDHRARAKNAKKSKAGKNMTQTQENDDEMDDDDADAEGDAEDNDDEEGEGEGGSGSEADGSGGAAQPICPPRRDRSKTPNASGLSASGQTIGQSTTDSDGKNDGSQKQSTQPSTPKSSNMKSSSSLSPAPNSPPDTSQTVTPTPATGRSLQARKKVNYNVDNGSSD